MTFIGCVCVCVCGHSFSRCVCLCVAVDGLQPVDMGVFFTCNVTGNQSSRSLLLPLSLPLHSLGKPCASEAVLLPGMPGSVSKSSWSEREAFCVTISVQCFLFLF